MAPGRTLPAAQIRLGMRLANGLEVSEILRPSKATVKRGYGRVCVTFDDGDGWNYYPSDLVRLHDTEDAPADRTMDDWPGRWWPVDRGASGSVPGASPPVPGAGAPGRPDRTGHSPGPVLLTGSPDDPNP